MAGHDGRRAAGHRLDGGHAERLVPRTEHEAVGGAVPVRQVDVGDELVEDHLFAEAEFRHQRGELIHELLLGAAEIRPPRRDAQTRVRHPFRHHREGADEQVVALVARQPSEREDGRPFEAEPFAGHLPGGGGDREETVVVVTRGDHAHPVALHAVIVDQQVGLDGRRGDHQVAFGVDQPLMMDAFLEVVLPLELVVVAGIVGAHLRLLPAAERVRRMHVRRRQRLRQQLAGVAGVPVMAVDEGVAEVVPAHDRQHLARPFLERAVQVFLGEEVRPAAGHAQHADPVPHHVHLRLALELPGPDVDLVAHVRELAGELQHIDDLPAGVRLPERRLGRHVTVRRDHGDARETARRSAGQTVIDIGREFGSSHA